VGASLGRDSIRQGVAAAAIGMAFLGIFMIVYYRLSGVNAIVALAANLLILLGAMAYTGATLTLPGIAGVILTVGVGVDTNVLVFERIREELRNGKTVKAAINVTPMADIMIVLLIIFMVITPMLQKGVDVKLPLAGNTKERKDEPKTITVAVKKDATTFLGGKKLDKQEDLVPQLKERLEDLPEGGKMIYLKADQELAYSEVMKVMDLAREAGVEEIALIAEPKAAS